MSSFRFALVTVVLFVLAFVGVSWVRAGFPIVTFGVAALKPNPQLPTFDQAREKAIREEWVNSKTNQSDGDVQRDRLRLDLLQASTAYKMSPCDDTMKKNLVEALSRYAVAWHDMAFCESGAAGCPTNADDRLDFAAAAFKTPADINVRQTLREAMQQGGISRNDFPNSMRNYVFLMSGTPPTTPQAECRVARRP